ncbi:MAG: hypothetical protein H0W72_07750, partial [Planctomycetes bacterium]|nr:hypothetical protein [Planctomycetota bacterium]
MLAGSAWSAEPPVAPANGEKPWSEQFTMVLKEHERTFVVYNGAAYLVMQADDLKDPGFLDRKDVMIDGKFERADRDKAWFYHLDKLVALAPADRWATRLEGDNLHIFGKASTGTAANGLPQVTLAVTAVEVAASDAQVIAKLIDAVPANDYDARLKLAASVRETGQAQGNRDFWNVSADNIVVQAIDAALIEAEAKKDAKLLHKAMGWAIDTLKDPTVAARVGSQAWIQQAGGPDAEAVARRMRALDFEFYNGQWRPRPEAYVLQFDDRFNAIAWRDAESYYKLGRWVEANAELIPRARELSHRAYQAAYRADPKHNGTRRELGLEAISAGGGDKSTPKGPFNHADSGLVLDGPEGWLRSDPISGDATWIDPKSDTAFVSIKVLQGDSAGVDFEAAWTRQRTALQGRQGFAVIEEVDLPFRQGKAKRMRFSYKEGRYTRLAETVVAYGSEAKCAVVLDGSFTEGEQDAVGGALLELFERLVIPAAKEKGAIKQPSADGAGTQDTNST